MDADYLELVSACALNRIFGYEPQISNNLIKTLGSARAAFELSEGDLDYLFGPYSRFRGRIQKKELDISADELYGLGMRGCFFLPATDPNFPIALKECPDCPAGLYVRSSFASEDIFNKRPMIAVVGTRDISPYGKECCERVVSALSGAKVTPTIVSGLALGVDITAHLCALQNSAPTIAVLPCGIDSTYPSSHTRYAEIISNSPGSALVSDYPPNTRPVAVTFLRRNRIIAGLCSSTILIESKKSGGGLITTNFAFDYGRDVYALPGRIDDLRSQGCNNLIKQCLARPIDNIADLPTELGLGTFNRRQKNDLLEEALNSYDSHMDKARLKSLVEILKLIKSERGICIDDICRRCHLPYAEVSSIANMLESDGFIFIDLLQRCSIQPKKL